MLLFHLESVVVYSPLPHPSSSTIGFSFLKKSLFHLPFNLKELLINSSLSGWNKFLKFKFSLNLLSLFLLPKFFLNKNNYFDFSRVKENSDPTPNSLSTYIFSSWASIMCFTIASPKPDPPELLLPLLSTLKNLSNILV